MFPLGDTLKADVRAEAAARGLRVADKPDSHDICFIPSGDTRGFLAARLGARPGAVVDAGTGRGAGPPRRRARLHGRPAPRPRAGPRPPRTGGPRYVLGIEPVSGTVRVGPAEALDVHVVERGAPVWTSGAAPGPFDAVVQVRAHGGLAPARVVPDGAPPARRAGRAPPRRRPGPGGGVLRGRPGARQRHDHNDALTPQGESPFSGACAARAGTCDAHRREVGPRFEHGSLRACAARAARRGWRGGRQPGMTPASPRPAGAP